MSFWSFRLWIGIFRQIFPPVVEAARFLIFAQLVDGARDHSKGGTDCDWFKFIFGHFWVASGPLVFSGTEGQWLGAVLLKSCAELLPTFLSKKKQSQWWRENFRLSSFFFLKLFKTENKFVTKGEFCIHNCSGINPLGEGALYECWTNVERLSCMPVPAPRFTALVINVIVINVISEVFEFVVSKVKSFSGNETSWVIANI